MAMTKCMSFNVLTWNKQCPDWCMTEDIRQPKAVELILKYEPDLLGIQEADNVLSYWADYLSARLQQTRLYRCLKLEDEEIYTVKHEGSTYPVQFCSSGLMIFYRRDRYDLISHGAFEYSSADDQGRFFQWARLLDKESGRELLMTNTHWAIDRTADGVWSKEAGDLHRTIEAKELLDFWTDNAGESTPLFATGDYNARMGSKWIDAISSGPYKEVSEVIGIPKGTDGMALDHCFISPAVQTVGKCHFIEDTFTVDGVETHYSDHYPFWAEIYDKEE